MQIVESSNQMDVGGHWTVPELSFEKKQLILEIQQLVISYQT